MRSAIARVGWTATLLYATTLFALLLVRPRGDFYLPPLWLYIAWPVLPTLAGTLPMLADAKSAWIRIPQILVAMLLYWITWLGQFRLLAPIMLRPNVDRELSGGFANFYALSDRPLNYSLLAAFLCLSLVVMRNDLVAWGRAIWSGETDAVIAMRDETRLHRAMRIIVGTIIGALAAAWSANTLAMIMDTYAFSSTGILADLFIVLACQVLTLAAAWRLASRKRGVMLALSIASTYLLTTAVLRSEWMYALEAIPAMFGLLCVAAIVRRGRLRASAVG